MNSDQLVPFGEGFKGDYAPYKYKLIEVFVLSKIVNEFGMPFIFIQNSKKREYRKTIYKGENFFIDSEAFKRFLKYYNPPENSYKIKIHFSFDTTKSSNIFKNYVDF
jgi:hypothetical protein